MASTEQVMASTEQVMASTEQVMASTEQIMTSTEQIMSATLNPVPEPIIAPNHSFQVSSTLCPWSKIAASEAVSFYDIMMEQLDKSSQEIDNTNHILQSVYVDNLIDSGEEIDDCSDDFLIAKILQLDFNREHDNILKQKESKYNRSHKVKTSLQKYLLCSEANSSSDDNNEYFDDSLDYLEESLDYLEENDQNHQNKFYNAEKSTRKSGVYHQGNTTTTKHDSTVCGRRNAGKMMELPPSIPTGDGSTFNMKISNNVFTTLKTYSMAEDKRSHKE